MQNVKKYMYSKLYYPIYLLCKNLFYYLPVKKNKIVFCHHRGLGYACNLKYITEEILRQKQPWDIVWLVEKDGFEFPAKVKTSRINRIKGLYDLATANIFINNLKDVFPVNKKSGQTFIYIPHGMTGAKKGEKEMNCLSPEYEAISIEHSKQTDIFVTCSEAQSRDMVDNFYCECEILQAGFPRNDIFFHYNQDKVKDIKLKLNIDFDSHCVFYAPTFRESGDDAYGIDMTRLRNALETKFGGRWIVLVRLHPNFIWYNSPKFEYSDFVINMTSYDDIQELFLISDMLITDYSSTMFDFSISRRPVFLFALDVEEYRKFRGLKDFFFTVPFPLCKSNDELIKAICDYNAESYQHQLEEFNKIYGDVDDGYASERVVERLKRILK